MATQYSRSRPLSEAGSEAEAMLGRYPDLSERELDRLVEIYPGLAMLDLALMGSSAALSRKMDAFERAHGARLRTHRASHAMFFIAFLVLPVATAAILLWWVLHPGL